jgi:hypothetical protein
MGSATTKVTVPAAQVPDARRRAFSLTTDDCAAHYRAILGWLAIPLAQFARDPEAAAAALPEWDALLGVYMDELRYGCLRHPGSPLLLIVAACFEHWLQHGTFGP